MLGRNAVALENRLRVNSSARWYDPEVGRWLSEDPIGFEAGDANLYRYVGNENTGAVDPSGQVGRGDIAQPLPLLRPKPSPKPQRPSVVRIGLVPWQCVCPKQAEVTAEEPMISDEGVGHDGIYNVGPEDITITNVGPVPVIGGPRNTPPPGSGGFWDSLHASWQSVQHTYTSLMLSNWYGMDELGDKYMDMAYHHSPIGQVEDAPSWVSVGTKGSFALATGATAAAALVLVVQGATGSTMSVTVVSNGGRTTIPHVGWQVGGQWYHATGWGNGYFQSFAWQTAARMGAGGWWNTLSGIPIRNPAAAAGFTGYTYNCVTGAARAIWNGWTAPLIVGGGIVGTVGLHESEQEN